MSYTLYSKLALGAFYVCTFAVFWYGYKRRGWAFEDVVGISLFMLILLFITFVIEVVLG